jgi:hypothetical protein
MRDGRRSAWTGTPKTFRPGFSDVSTGLYKVWQQNRKPDVPLTWFRPGISSAYEGAQYRWRMKSDTVANSALSCGSSREPDLLTKVQLARDVLQCSPRHVERLQRNRTIPVVRLSSRCVRYSRQRVLAAISKREQEAIVE